MKRRPAIAASILRRILQPHPMSSRCTLGIQTLYRLSGKIQHVGSPSRKFAPGSQIDSPAGWKLKISQDFVELFVCKSCARFRKGHGEGAMPQVFGWKLVCLGLDCCQ